MPAGVRSTAVHVSFGVLAPSISLGLDVYNSFRCEVGHMLCDEVVPNRMKTVDGRRRPTARSPKRLFRASLRDRGSSRLAANHSILLDRHDFIRSYLAGVNCPPGASSPRISRFLQSLTFSVRRQAVTLHGCR
jgi:hypothetical protein